MKNSLKIFAAVMVLIMILAVLPGISTAQFKYPVILPMKTVKDLINEVSGAVPFNIMQEIAAFNRNRKAAEYQDLYWESEVITRYAKEYGFSDVKVEKFDKTSRGGTPTQWDAETGELWMVSPEEQLIISHRDIPAALARGSKSADVTAELVYVENGTKESDYEGMDVKGKIVLVSGIGTSWGGATGGAYRIAVNKLGALGVVSFRTARPYDRPDQIPWASIRGNVKEATFGFNLPFRIGDDLRIRLLRGEKIKVRAKVKTAVHEVDYELPTAIIPGTGDGEEEIIMIAHLFEGVTKQGANDNISGCVAILEAGRTILRLIEEGKIEQPERTIRFLWVPEIGGTYLYFEKYPDIVKKAIAGINMDMVGEDNKKNLNSLWMTKSLQSLQGFPDDFAEHFFEFVGYTNMELYPQRTRTPYPMPIIDPTGSQDQFYYYIDKYAGGSDHIVLESPKYKIPTPYYNNWPDMHYHSSEDRPDKSDPTQLKRVSFLGAVLAYTIANGGAEDVPVFITELSGKSGKRLEKDMQNCLYALTGCEIEKLPQTYKEQKSKVHWVHEREKKNILSLKVFAKKDPAAGKLINEMAEAVMRKEPAAQAQLKIFYNSLCTKNNVKPVELKLTEDEKSASKVIPSNLQFEGSRPPRIRVAGIPYSMFTELLNFIDGKKSVLDIRDAAAAEFRPVDIKLVMEYFTKLKEQGAVTLK